MYHVIVMKHISKSENIDDFDGRQFYCYLTLPFPPYVGLSISTSGWVCPDIESVHWTQNEESGQQYFTCRVAGERPHWVDRHFYDYEYLCENALQDFWEPYNKESKVYINQVTQKSI